MDHHWISYLKISVISFLLFSFFFHLFKLSIIFVKISIILLWFPMADEYSTYNYITALVAVASVIHIFYIASRQVLFVYLG